MSILTLIGILLVASGWCFMGAARFCKNNTWANAYSLTSIALCSAGAIVSFASVIITVVRVTS